MNSPGLYAHLTDLVPVDVDLSGDPMILQPPPSLTPLIDAPADNVIPAAPSAICDAVVATNLSSVVRFFNVYLLPVASAVGKLITAPTSRGAT
jgi:hypothetical protein